MCLIVVTTAGRAIGLLKIKSKRKRTINNFNLYEENLYIHKQQKLRLVRNFVLSAQSENINGTKNKGEIMED